MSWFSNLLNAFTGLFGIKSASAEAEKSALTGSRQFRRTAGHWPVWIELGKTTREQTPPHDDSCFTLRFSASDAPLLRSLGIQSRDFDGIYVSDKQSAVVQLPERLVEELGKHVDPPVYVEAFLDGQPLGSRKFSLPLRF
ncbi:hypothetical protein [Chitinimonas sp. BJYL2]|uniref:hypothetical protein n=1 Tax=Chitinimonas sp. BJYL2 TaxID=2976696 RepID=UPI0022B4FA6B|nr:hypothetical protein [Chitinimonas sp. BJYL2]